MSDSILDQTTRAALFHRAARDVQVVTGAAYTVALAEVKRRHAAGELTAYLVRVDALEPPPGGPEDMPRCVRCLAHLLPVRNESMVRSFVHRDEATGLATGIAAGKCTL